MKYIPIVLGILALLFMFTGLIPCLGSLNYINFMFSVPGVLLAYYFYSQTEESKHDGINRTGLILNASAIIIGFVRLYIGGGIL